MMKFPRGDWDLFSIPLLPSSDASVPSTEVTERAMLLYEERATLWLSPRLGPWMSFGTGGASIRVDDFRMLAVSAVDEPFLGIFLSVGGGPRYEPGTTGLGISYAAGLVMRCSLIKLCGRSSATRD